MTIFLIGYRGSGKTTVGQILARKLSLPFIDSDHRIVAAAKMTIKEIFTQHGEEKFRELESAAVLELATLQNHVISLGGGALLREQNRRAVQSPNHTIIYLHADPIELHRRIHQDTATAAHRPSLTPLGGGIEEIRSVLAAREPIYRQVMTFEIDVTNASPDEVANTIIHLLDQKKSKT